MKKRLFAILVACMVIMALGLTACISNGKYADDAHIGTWSAKSVEYSGITLEASDLFEQFDITLEADGSASVSANFGGNEQIGKGEWEPSDKGITLKDSNLSDETLEMSDSDNDLVLEYEGMSIIFAKSA